MKTLSVVALLTFALAACGQSAPQTSPLPESAPAQPAPADTDNMSWTFDLSGRTEAGAARPRLMYHSGGSEGLAINLQCDPGADTAHALLWRGEQRATWPFSLTSGDSRADLTGATSGESEVIVRASLPLDAPVLEAFRQSGELTLIDGELQLPMNAINAQERAAIAGFFTACR